MTKAWNRGIYGGGNRADKLLRDLVHLLLVIAGALTDLIRSSRLVDGLAQFGGGKMLNFLPVTESQHENRHAKNKSANATNAAVELVTAFQAMLPVAVCLHPMGDLNCSDVHGPKMEQFSRHRIIGQIP